MRSSYTQAFLAASVAFLGLQVPAGAQVDPSNPVAQIGGGNPGASDKSRSVRGLGARILQARAPAYAVSLGRRSN